MQFNVAIIGAGLIGRKRAAAISKTGIGSLRAVVDINKDAAKKLATEFGGEAESDWRKVVTRKDINIVIVSTINSVLAPISIAALESGKHVLCEKPFGRNIKEAENILKAASKKNLVIKTGFNHRFHPAVWKAKQISPAHMK
ncbi:Oxidoreductase family, NAD-binding Rossmann fold [Candidatus Kryptonium thompsonii]|nr:Oxidoreductase family, NAD-binding Rossmann fold [Candidatus Kryptonium thompsoni]